MSLSLNRGKKGLCLDLKQEAGRRAVDMVWDLENSKIGHYKMPGHPIRFSKTPVKPDMGAPTLGEHTLEILQQFGFSEDEIRELKSSNIVK